jgi:hypothetical protein
MPKNEGPRTRIRNKLYRNKTRKNEDQHALNSRLPLVFTIDNNILHTSEERRILSDWGAVSKIGEQCQRLGSSVKDWGAVSKMGQLVAKKTEKQGILDLWMILDCCS